MDSVFHLEINLTVKTLGKNGLSDVLIGPAVSSSSRIFFENLHPPHDTVKLIKTSEWPLLPKELQIFL